MHITPPEPVGPIGEILWQPDAGRIASTALARFAGLAGFATDDYAGLHAWSVAEPEAFHSRLWDFLGIIGHKGNRAVVRSASQRETRFFPDARFNYAENLLKEPDDRPAIIAHRDDGTRRELSRRELLALVSRCVQALKAEGIGPGDRIAAIVTNDIEAITFYLASAAIGAIWASCSPDFGPAGAGDRLSQVEPSILLAVPSYGYAGKVVETTASINAVAETTAIRRIVLLGPAPEGAAYAKPALSLEDWLAPFSPAPVAWHRCSFETPLAILFPPAQPANPNASCIHRAGCCSSI